MLTYRMDHRGTLPLYEYLYRRIREDILSGTLRTHERLPSKRSLAEHLHISVITVEAAYQQLEAEGYLYTRPRLVISFEVIATVYASNRILSPSSEY